MSRSACCLLLGLISLLLTAGTGEIPAGPGSTGVRTGTPADTGGATAPVVLPGDPSTSIPGQARALQAFLDSSGLAARFGESREASRNWKAVRAFYSRRGYRPAWNDGRGDWHGVKGLVEALAEAEWSGFDPGDYPAKAVAAAVQQAPRGAPREEAGLDLYLSYLFLTYARHISQGRVDPTTIDKDWHIRPRGPDLAAALERAVDSGAVRRVLRELRPEHPEYHRLARALADYHRIEADGGWPEVTEAQGRFKLVRGDTAAKVVEIRHYLQATGDLALGPIWTPPDVFDEILEEGVRHFQARHGILEDGVVGPQTLHEMTVPVEVRMRTIEINMERWRWLPDTLGTRYVEVNVPAFRLQVMEGKEPVLSMRVVTGTEYNATPVFADRITYIDVNPRWNVPESIAGDEVLPKVQDDPDYLAKHDMTVLDKANQPVDPGTVDWDEVRADSLPFRFRQEAGPQNPLGRIKFMFPNQFSVYLHDTSQPHLFDRYNRSFSHGCVRIEKPLEFAAYLLRDTDWTAEKVKAVMDSRKHRIISLKTPMPVYLLYWTAFVDPDGTVEFRRDLYRHDARLAQALDEYRPLYLEPSAFSALLSAS